MIKRLKRYKIIIDNYGKDKELIINELSEKKINKKSLIDD
jgi:hypothetical protein